MVYRVLSVFVEIPEIEARYCHSFLLSWRTAASLIIPVPSISSKLASIHSNNVSALGERQLPRWDQDDFSKKINDSDDRSFLGPIQIVIDHELLLYDESRRIEFSHHEHRLSNLGSTNTLGEPHISDKANPIEWNKMEVITARTVIYRAHYYLPIIITTLIYYRL